MGKYEDMEHPVVKFNQWWKVALDNTPLKQKNAVCVSTVDSDGFPAGRFVDLKAVSEKGFTFCTYLDSKKGVEISANSKIAMTVWWDHVGYQVRVTGFALSLSEKDATRFWESRSRDAQLTTICSLQSQILESEEVLQEQLLTAREKFSSEEIPKPNNWGGFTIQPISIEFLTFNDNKLHLRELFEFNNGEWNKRLLQP